MLSQELKALLQANSDRQCGDLELEQEAKDELKKLMGWKKGFRPQTYCSTILTKLGVSGDDAEEVGVEEDSDDTGYTMSPSADEVISFLERNPQLHRYCDLPPNIKEGYRKALGLTIVGNTTNCTTLLKNLYTKFGRGTEGGYIPRIPAEGGGGGGSGGIGSHGSLSPVDDMSQASSPSRGARHEPSPQTGRFWGSLFRRDQSANTSQDSDGDSPPGAFEDVGNPGDDDTFEPAIGGRGDEDVEDASEPVFKKTDVDRMLNLCFKVVAELKYECRRLASMNASMQEHMRAMKRPENPDDYMQRVEQQLTYLTSDRTL